MESSTLISLSALLLSILLFIYGLITNANKHRTQQAITEYQIIQMKEDRCQDRRELQLYKDKNDNKFKDILNKMDEHYRMLMEEIRELRK